MPPPQAVTSQIRLPGGLEVGDLLRGPFGGTVDVDAVDVAYVSGQTVHNLAVARPRLRIR